MYLCIIEYEELSITEQCDYVLEPFLTANVFETRDKALQWKSAHHRGRVYHMDTVLEVRLFLQLLGFVC